MHDPGIPYYNSHMRVMQEHSRDRVDAVPQHLSLTIYCSEIYIVASYHLLIGVMVILSLKTALKLVARPLPSLLQLTSLGP